MPKIGQIYPSGQIHPNDKDHVEVHVHAYPDSRPGLRFLQRRT
jgi:hypothetical protein